MKFIDFKEKILGILMLPLIMLSCTDHEEIQGDTLSRLAGSVEKHFIEDNRTAVFDIRFEKETGYWNLHGETDKSEAFLALLDSLERQAIEYRDSVIVLPHPDLEGRIHGIIRISVANLRAEPGHPAELVTQALLGSPVRILKKKGGWYFIQTPDRYLGWVDTSGVTIMDDSDFEKYQAEPKIIFTGIKGFSYTKPDENSLPVSDLVAGNVLSFLDFGGGFYNVRYPDSRMAYVKASEVRDFSYWTGGPDPDTLVTIAMHLMGIPYLWGGTSVKGFDCSGFTKIIFFLNGLVLPRDASQQDDIGILVDDRKDYSLLEPGDLLFFGKAATDSTAERVVHVGMWIGDMKFIHSSGDVHISSMDKTDPAYDQYNDNRYLKAKRIINTAEAKEILISRFY